MKMSPLFILFVVIGTAYYVSAQTSGGGGGGGTAGGGGGASGHSSATAPATTTPAPTSPATTQPNPATPRVTPFSPAISNQVVTTNQFGNNTNEEEEEEEEREHREHRDRDRNNMSPTGANSGTNQFGNNFVFTDRAATTADQSLLVTLRQAVQSQLGVTVAANMPVHFVINNGVVTLLGTVPTADESQRILQVAQQTAGVSQVVNRLQVGTPTTTATQANASPSSSAIGGTTTDHAFSASDRMLLFKVQQQASSQIGNTAANGFQLPVHFSIQNGVVTVMGQLFSSEEKAKVLAAVQNVPGVTRVVDNVTISATTPRATVNPSLNNRVAPTPTGP